MVQARVNFHALIIDLCSKNVALFNLYLCQKGSLLGGDLPHLSADFAKKCR